MHKLTQAHIWNHVLSFQNSMPLKCAVELGIPDAIQKHGKPMTPAELASALAIHPTKASSLPRLMRLLVHSNFFSKKNLDNGETVYDLTINSQLLLKDHPFTHAHVALDLHPLLISLTFNLGSRFKGDVESPFHITHGKSFWEYADNVRKFDEEFYQRMLFDSQLIASLLLNNDEFKGLLEGVNSLVDVGGRKRTMANAIAEAYPELKCIVFDLPYVVEGLQSRMQNLEYVGGDMFESIPPCQVVLLK